MQRGTDNVVKLVATSGCFDIIHAGHVALFGEMRKLAGPSGIVVVLVNSDDYLRRKKGAHRPVQTLEHRMMILGAMEAIDVVLPFNDDNPCRMIQVIEPDIWVKGIEYKGKDIPEESVIAAIGGVVKYVDTGISVHTGAIITQLKAEDNKGGSRYKGGRSISTL